MQVEPGDKKITEEVLTALPQKVPTRRMLTALVLLCCCVGILMTGFGIIIPVVPQRLQALGLGAETLALMEGAFGLGMFLFSTPLGKLADRVGRKPLVLLSLVGFVGTNIGLAFTYAPAVFIALRFSEGALVAGLMPVTATIIGDSVPLEKQGRWIGFLTAAQASGFALGPGIGGLLYQALGYSSSFLISAGMALVAALLALVTLPETLPESLRKTVQLQRGKQQSKEKRRTQGSMQLLWLFAPLIAVDLCLNFIYPFVIPQYPFYFESVLKYNAAEYGLIISFYGLALAVFPMFLGRLSDIFPKKPLIIVGCLLFPALNVGMLYFHQYPLLIATALLTGVGDALLLPALATLYLAETNDQNRSQVMGLRGSVISLGALIGPLVQASVGLWITPEATFAIGTGLAVVAAVVALVALKNPRQEQTGDVLA